MAQSVSHIFKAEKLFIYLFVTVVTCLKWPKDLPAKRGIDFAWEEGKNGKECLSVEPHKKLLTNVPRRNRKPLTATPVVILFTSPGISEGSIPHMEYWKGTDLQGAE